MFIKNWKNKYKEHIGMPVHLSHDMGAGKDTIPKSRNVKKIHKKIKVIGNKINNFFKNIN